VKVAKIGGTIAYPSRSRDARGEALGGSQSVAPTAKR
jgi:hypothetical protein